MATATAPANTELQPRAKTDEALFTSNDAASALSSLDALFAEEAKKGGATDADLAAIAASKPEPAAAPVIDQTSSIDDAKQKEEEARVKAEADAKAKVEADAKAKSEADAKAKADADAAKTPEQKAAEEKAAADAKVKADADAAAKAGDKYDKIELPPHSSAKAGESFAALKKAAREAETALQSQVSDLNGKLTEATKTLTELQKNSGQLPEEVKVELEELRKFKIAHDVESDPSFQKFSQELNANHEAIYAKLKQAGYTDENIEHIKSLGGPDNVNWDPLLAKMPVQTRLFLQAKLVDNINISDRRTAALTEAKANGAKFLQERSERDGKELLDTANGYLTKFSWTAPKQVPANATDAQRAEIEAWNKDAGEAMNTIKVYLADRSATRHAELAIGTLLAHRFEKQLVAANSRISSMEAAHKTALEAITKERDQFKKDLDAIKKAEIPRTEQSLGVVTPPPKPVSANARPADALDALLAEEIARKNQ